MTGAAAHGFFSLAPFALLMAFGWVAVWEWDRRMCAAAAVFLFAGLVSNLGLKHTARALRLRSAVLHRPSSCPLAASGTCEQCSIIPSWRAGPLVGSSRLGFPSGHSQSLWMLAVLWLLHRGWVSPQHRLVSTWLIWAYAGSVSHQRVVVGCHSLLQVVVGAAVGVVIAVALSG